MSESGAISQKPRLSKAIGPLKIVWPSSLFMRFLFSGGLNTVFGYAMFLLSLKIGFSVGVALVTSTVAGIFFNFQTSRTMVFSSRRRGRLVPFVAVYAVILAIDYATVLVLKHAGLQDWSAQAVMVIPITLMSFYAQRHFVFRDKVSA